jgi:hypothetical protein
LKFLPKKFSICSQIYGFGIRDPRSGIRDPEKTYSESWIPDPGVKKAPDPGSGSATLVVANSFPDSLNGMERQVIQIFNAGAKTFYLQSVLTNVWRFIQNKSGQDQGLQKPVR